MTIAKGLGILTPMATKRLDTTLTDSGPRRVGRPARYGEATVMRPVYYPPVLLAKLREEAAWRAARAGNPDEWNVSRLVVDICAKHFGIELHEQER